MSLGLERPLTWLGKMSLSLTVLGGYLAIVANFKNHTPLLAAAELRSAVSSLRKRRRRKLRLPRGGGLFASRRFHVRRLGGPILLRAGLRAACAGLAYRERS